MRGFRKCRGAGAVVCASLVLAAPCSAAPPGDARWSALAGIGTDLPVAVGARAQVEAPFRLRLSTSIGILPAPYLDMINTSVEAFGGYDASTSALVAAALESSLAWRTHVGYRPFQHLGLYGEVGYGLVALGGSASGGELVAGVTGRPLPPNDGQRNYELQSSLHMLDVELGWDFALTERWYARTAIGGAFTVGAATTIRPAFTPRAPGVVSEFTSYGERYLDETYTSYVFTPVVGLGLGYRIF